MGAGAAGHEHRNLVLVSLSLHGHMTPMLQLADLLHSKGFSIAFVYVQVPDEAAPSDPSLDFPEFTFTPLTCDLSGVKSPWRSFATLLWTLNEGSKAPLLDLLTRMTKEERKEISCVVYDNVMFFAEEVARALDVPSIILNTGSAITALSLFQMSHLGLVYDSSKVDEPILCLEPLRFRDLFVHGIDDMETLMAFIPPTCTVRTSSAVIMNTADCLEQQAIEKLSQECWKVRIFSMGPLHRIQPKALKGERDRRCLLWLDKQACNSVLYASFGTLVSLDRSDFVELAEALANCKLPFIWVVRPGSVRGSDWREALPEDFSEKVEERGIMVDWAPQRAVLSHSAVGGFLSHCGWNSTLESIAEGVPMICRPGVGDQRTNARWVVEVWKVGLDIASENLERNEIERAISKLMVDKEGEEMRQRAKDLKGKIQASIGEGGTSRRSFDEFVDVIISH